MTVKTYSLYSAVIYPQDSCGWHFLRCHLFTTILTEFIILGQGLLSSSTIQSSPIVIPTATELHPYMKTTPFLQTDNQTWVPLHSYTHTSKHEDYLTPTDLPPHMRINLLLDTYLQTWGLQTNFLWWVSPYHSHLTSITILLYPYSQAYLPGPTTLTLPEKCSSHPHKGNIYLKYMETITKSYNWSRCRKQQIQGCPQPNWLNLQHNSYTQDSENITERRERL